MKLWQVAVNGKWEYAYADRVKLTPNGDIYGEQLQRRGSEEEFVVVWAWSRGLWAKVEPVDQVKEATELVS